MNDIQCRYRLPHGNYAGAVDLDTLKKWAAAYPHLRPCPKVHWDWVSRKMCGKCENRVEAGERTK